MVYPTDAITKTIDASGTQSLYLETGNATRTILGVSIQEDTINSKILCGNEEIIKNYAKNTQFNLINKVCKGDLVFNKAGNDTAELIITYVNRDITLQKTEPIFTYGDIINSVFLFLIFMVAFYSFIHFSLNRIKVDFRQK
jgi:hypothetical protein